MTTKRIHIITDAPDPDCPRCGGRGVVGGCGKPDCDHAHTISFCECVNERRVET